MYKSLKYPRSDKVIKFLVDCIIKYGYEMAVQYVSIMWVHFWGIIKLLLAIFFERYKKWDININDGYKICDVLVILRQVTEFKCENRVKFGVYI